MAVPAALLVGLIAVPAQAASAGVPLHHSGAAIDEKAPGRNPAIPAGTPRIVGRYNIPLTLTPTGGVKPDTAYPSGCGLAVILYRSGNILTGTETTSCNFTVSSIEHDIYLYRSRWYGWEKLTSKEDDISYNVYSKGTSISYNCAGTGTHDFQVQGYGYVYYGGTSYYASAYDEIDSVSC